MVNENKIWVTVAYTINLGNYESLKIEAGATMTQSPELTISEQHAQMADNFMQTVVKRVESSREEIEDIKDEIDN